MAAKIFKDIKLKNILFRATNLCHKIIQINKIMISIKFRIMVTPSKGEGKKTGLGRSTHRVAISW